MAEHLQEKKHAPTARRRKKARESGQVAKSQELSSAAMLLIAIGCLWYFGGTMAGHLAATMTETFSNPQLGGYDIASAQHSFMRIGARLFYAAAPLLLTLMGCAILVNISQTGFIFSLSRATPKLKHINPFSGAARILSLGSLGKLGFGLVKLTAIIAVAYIAASHYVGRLIHMGSYSLPQIAQVLFESILGVCLWIGLGLLLLSLIDYAVQRWRHEQELMMTDEELREEMREIEGDPIMVNHRRMLQKKLVVQQSR